MIKKAYNYWSGTAGAIGGAFLGNKLSHRLVERLYQDKDELSLSDKLKRFGIITLGTIGGAAGGSLAGRSNIGPGGNQTAYEKTVKDIEKQVNDAYTKWKNKSLSKAYSAINGEATSLYGPRNRGNKKIYDSYIARQKYLADAMNKEVNDAKLDSIREAIYKSYGFKPGQRTTGYRGIANKAHNYLGDYANLGNDVLMLSLGGGTIYGTYSGLKDYIRNRGSKRKSDNNN
jgi:hypothetical protein